MVCIIVTGRGIHQIKRASWILGDATARLVVPNLREIKDGNAFIVVLTPADLMSPRKSALETLTVLKNEISPVCQIHDTDFWHRVKEHDEN